MITLGITGRSGCGKSTVTAVFSAHGVPLADADLAALEAAANALCEQLLAEGGTKGGARPSI